LGFSDMHFQLYTYFRSTAAYRVRIALNYKQIDYDAKFIHLLKNGGENYSQRYKTVNPQSMVPSLIVVGEGKSLTLTQSIAIIEYLEEKFPTPSLLPQGIEQRVKVRAVAQIIACDIHPLNNLRVLDYLTKSHHVDDDAKNRWYQHWIYEGFNAIEMLISQQSREMSFCFGESPSLADICLVPQVFNAKRFQCNLEPYPVINRVYGNCMKIKSFIDAAPENQADFEP